MKIKQLGLEHEAALRAFLEDFEQAGEERIPAYFADPAWTYDQIVDAFEKQSQGENLPDGWVPCTTLFLEDAGRLLGVANVRHRLTEGLLRFGGHVGYAVRPSARCRGHATRLLESAMAYARNRLGIDRLLLTCASENPASSRVIEKCGGVLESEAFYELVGKRIRRYWIAL